MQRREQITSTLSTLVEVAALSASMWFAPYCYLPCIDAEQELRLRVRVLLSLVGGRRRQREAGGVRGGADCG